jgi:hypothetical protein
VDSIRWRTSAVAVEDVTESGGDGLVCSGEGVGADAEGRRRIGVSRSTGHGTDVVALTDGDGGRPVADPGLLSRSVAMHGRLSADSRWEFSDDGRSTPERQSWNLLDTQA